VAAVVFGGLLQLFRRAVDFIGSQQCFSCLGTQHAQIDLSMPRLRPAAQFGDRLTRGDHAHPGFSSARPCNNAFSDGSVNVPSSGPGGCCSGSNPSRISSVRCGRTSSASRSPWTRIEVLFQTRFAKNHSSAALKSCPPFPAGRSPGCRTTNRRRVRPQPAQVGEPFPPLLHQLRLAHAAGRDDLHDVGLAVVPGVEQPRQLLVPPLQKLARVGQPTGRDLRRCAMRQ